MNCFTATVRMKRIRVVSLEIVIFQDMTLWNCAYFNGLLLFKSLSLMSLFCASPFVLNILEIQPINFITRRGRGRGGGN